MRAPTMARPREFDEDRVLDAVMNAFWLHGYERTSAQDLVEATGLGRGSLYNAYTSKDQLFEQALVRYQRRTAETVALFERPGPVRRNLRDLLVSVVDADLGDPGRRGCLVTNTAISRAGHHRRTAALVRRHFDVLHQGLERTIQRGQRTGELTRREDAATLASYILTVMQGLRVLAKVVPKGHRRRLMDVIDTSLESLT